MIFRGWQRSPPVHHLAAYIASYLGWNPSGISGDEIGDPNNLTAVPDQMIVVNDNRLPAVTFDVEELRRRNEEAAIRIAERDAVKRAKVAAGG